MTIPCDDLDLLLDRIRIDPAVCHGKPCIRGHRIWVTLILDFLASGETVEDILANYPELEREDILACIAYGAEMSRQRFVDRSRIRQYRPRLNRE